MTYHFLYITTNKLDSKFYIGKHTTEDLNDGYLGSGKRIRNAVLKHGVENFERKIILFCKDNNHLNEAEKEAILPEFIEWKMCYNLALGGTGGAGTLADPEVKARHKKKMIEIYSDPAIRAKFTNPSEDIRKKIKDSLAETNAKPETKARRATAMKKVMSDPLIQEKHHQSMIEAMNRPDIKEKHREAMKRIRNDPEKKAIWSAAINTPEMKEKQKLLNKEIANRPEVKAKSAATRKTTKETESLEEKQKRRERNKEIANRLEVKAKIIASRKANKEKREKEALEKLMESNLFE